MLKVLVLAAQNNVSDARMEWLIRDRLSWLRFFGFDLGAATPDANTIRMFRERLTAVDALDTVFGHFGRQLKARGYLPMGGQIVDDEEAQPIRGIGEHRMLVASPKQRNTEAEKAVKEGKSAAEIWPDEPVKAQQKDTDSRWMLKFAKARPTADGTPQPDIAIPSFGYKSSISICRAFGLIPKGKVTDGARYDGRMLREVVTGDNTASDVWADTAYRSQSNERWLKAQGRVSRIQGKAVRCRRMSGASTLPNPRSGPASSMCSRTRRRKWACSSAPSASPAPRPRSRSRIWRSTCTG